MQRLSDVMRLDMIVDKSAEEIKEVRMYVRMYFMLSWVCVNGWV